MIRLIDLLENRILIPRHPPEERKKMRLISAKKSIEQCQKKTCKGDLDLSDVTGITLPDNLVVAGTLNLRNTNLEKLPRNLSVGSLVLYGLIKIETIPSTVRVKHSLNINNTGIKRIETVINLTGNLQARDTYIDTLPVNTTIGGSADLTGSRIKHLPVDLKIKEDLTVRNTPLAREYSVEQLKDMLPGVKGQIHV